jgi:hypothetical protein
MLGRGSVAITFALGAVLSFPGVSYLNALGHIVKLNLPTVPTVLLVVYFVTVQSSGPAAGIPGWCSEFCGHGPRGGGGDL